MGDVRHERGEHFIRLTLLSLPTLCPLAYESPTFAALITKSGANARIITSHNIHLNTSLIQAVCSAVCYLCIQHLLPYQWQGSSSWSYDRSSTTTTMIAGKRQANSATKRQQHTLTYIRSPAVRIRKSVIVSLSDGSSTLAKRDDSIKNRPIRTVQKQSDMIFPERIVTHKHRHTDTRTQ